MNNITLLGRLVAAIELKETPNKVTYTDFTLAVRRDKEHTDFIDCTAFNKTAELLSQYTKKGDSICIAGSLRQDLYEDKKGNKRNKIRVMVNTADFCEPKPSEEKPKRKTKVEDDLEDQPF